MLPVALWLVLALCGAWALFAHGPWASDDKKGLPLAAVPDEICSGIIEADDLLGVEAVRRTEKIEQRMDGDAETHLTCTVGGASSGDPTLRFEVQPLATASPDWPMQTVPESTPMGPGLTGMVFHTSGWIVVPCPGNTLGDLVARAEIRWWEPTPEEVFSMLHVAGIPQPELSPLLVHSANKVATQLGCQIGTLPEPTARLAPTPGSSAFATICNIPSDENLPISEFSARATPIVPAPLEICRMTSASTSRAFALQFVTYRGPLAKLAPTAGTEVPGSGRAAVVSTGTCGDKPVVWTAWIREPGAGDTAVVAAHDRIVDAAVQHDHCVVTDRVVAPEKAAPPPSTPTSATPRE